MLSSSSCAVAIKDNSTLPGDDRIELQVGEKVFFTTKTTLTKESAYFQSMFLGPWNDQRADGSYFIDGDGEMFAHILSYLRRGMFPVFYEGDSGGRGGGGGHNLVKYHAMLEDARYFAIPALERWLLEERYLKAVEITRTLDVVAGPPERHSFPHADSQHSKLQFTPMRPKMQRTYVCPRGIAVHYGAREKCGQACDRAQGDYPLNYDEEEVEQTLVVKTDVRYDRELCMGV